MGGFIEKILILFLTGVIAALLGVIIIFADYSGFIDVRSNFPEAIKNTTLAKEYIKWAKINSLSPRDQQQVLLEEKKQYVEKLLQRVKLESLRIHEEKQKLENLFKVHEEDKVKFEKKVKRFQENEKKINEKREKEKNSELDARLDTLAITYAKMDAQKAAEIINLGDAEESFEILKRMKPKTLGKILENLDGQKAQELILRMQRK